MSNIAAAIKSTIEEITRLDTAKKHHDLLVNSVKEMQAELAGMTLQLSEELEDIEKMEKLSVKSVFHKILGNKEEAIEKERQEYLALSMKIKELKKSIELSEYEITVVAKKAADAQALVHKLDELKKEREAELLTHPTSITAALKTILGGIDEYHRYIAELKEAHVAGQNVLKATSNTKAHIEEAINYGEWDMMSGRMQSTMYEHQKHSAMDRAVDAAYNSQQYIQIFNKELADIGIKDQLYFKINTVSKFGDVFLDNLISDWIVQNQLKNTYNHVEVVENKVNILLQTINNEVDKSQKAIDELFKDKDTILLQ
jgi:hypothetical protein